MFDSNITAEDFVRDIMNETDIAPDIEERVYYHLIDETEQLLYSEIIKETAVYTGNVSDGGEVKLPEGNNETDAVRPEDVYAVYAGDVQLIKATPTGCKIFPDSWCGMGKNISVNAASDSVKVYYYIRPALKSGEGGKTRTVKLPVEWLRVIGAKVRGEAYKLVNEDSASAKWLADYNVLVEQLRQYMELRAPDVGIR